jgi:hypothetical protein
LRTGFITDNSPPQIFANFSLNKNATTDSEGLPVYRRQTSLFLGATDNISGVHKIYYSFDGGKEMEYSTPLVLDREGTFDLEIRVDDNLGNPASKHLRFVIKGSVQFDALGSSIIQVSAESFRRRGAGGDGDCLRAGAG